jgi:hypothetical protein
MAVAAALSLSLGVPNPHVGLGDAVRYVQVSRWNAVVAWNDEVQRQRSMISPMTTTRTGNRQTNTSPRSPNQSPMGTSWDATAECESSNDWSTNTGNGYFGGLQESMPFWIDNGGLEYAARPDLATKAEQIAVAERGAAKRGNRGDWPVCG